jgi:hypothetical protein
VRLGVVDKDMASVRGEGMSGREGRVYESGSRGKVIEEKEGINTRRVNSA